MHAQATYEFGPLLSGFCRKGVRAFGAYAMEDDERGNHPQAGFGSHRHEHGEHQGHEGHPRHEGQPAHEGHRGHEGRPGHGERQGGGRCSEGFDPRALWLAMSGRSEGHGPRGRGGQGHGPWGRG
ncbi:MAG: hypothetical protein ACYCX7_11000, partial [Solirubrobacteraceae bacterium]